jgi:DNA repair protein RadD
LIKKRPDIDFATGTTDDTIKRNKFKAFKNGQTRIFANVGVATTGLDCPSIDFIIIARATRSLSLYYQIIGRGQRIANGKKNCLITDLCGGLELFGDVQKLQVFQGVSGWIVSNGVIATNKSF